MQVVNGWFVDFSSDPEAGISSQVVRVAPSQLVIGLANGWAGNEKSVLLMPADVGTAWAALAAQGMAPRGAVFWTVTAEGATPPGQKAPLFMAAGLNAFLHTRS